MRRRTPLKRILLSLALGVITTIAVAWILAVLRPIPGSPRLTGRTFVLHDRVWITAEHHVLGVADIRWLHLADKSSLLSPRSVTVTEQLAEIRKSYTVIISNEPNYVWIEEPPSWGTLSRQPRASDLPPPGVHGTDTAFGFPLPCLWYRAVSPLKGPVFHAGGLDGGILLSGTLRARRPNDYTALPLWPIWSTFILNTVVYSAFWLIVLTGLVAARAMSRVRRGLCAWCAYDLRATPSDRPCPECGGVTVGRRPRGPQSPETLTHN